MPSFTKIAIVALAAFGSVQALPNPCENGGDLLLLETDSLKPCSTLWMLNCNLNYLGPDIDHFTADDIRTCARECQDHIDCVIAVFIPAAKKDNCWLKGGGGKFVDVKGDISLTYQKCDA
ncbi:hypothetical protein B0H63DRAFT_564205 [Podospora didyma]|uniref:Apple domain-containing protein n=1 Tax=Podospora didyma TaxID=330526 RepID=A0AAE0K5C3_9PEZI|nr:hypothetical protein B0H63DRAFT_564205 [Podospora didyma]